MHASDEIRRDLLPRLERSESETLIATALQLHAKTPTPTPDFPGKLRRRLLGAPEDRRTGASQRTALVLALSHIAPGLLLLVIAAISLIGIGPLAPG